MTITAGQLIRQALILAHVEDPEDEMPSTKQTLGLQYLNDVITQWGSLGIYIPYYTRTAITVTANVYQYTVEPVITQILEANIVDINNVQTPVIPASDKQQNLSNFQIVSGRPTSVYLDKVQVFPDITSSELGSDIYLFPNPDTNYTLNLAVKSQLQAVTLFEQMLMFPPSYIRPLRYEIAKEFIIQYGTTVDNFDSQYEKVMTELKAAIPVDMTTQVQNPLQQSWRFRPWGYYVG